MELDLLFKALADPVRRRLVEELSERDGQTVFELHARLATWHNTAMSRQALSKHLAALEEAKLIRTEWQWRSKFHFLERTPLRQLWQVWLGPLAEGAKDGERIENRRDQPAGR